MVRALRARYTVGSCSTRRYGRRKKLYTKAVDDLVGVFAIPRTAMDLHSGRRRKAPPFIGLLTRKEHTT